MRQGKGIKEVLTMLRGMDIKMIDISKYTGYPYKVSDCFSEMICCVYIDGNYFRVAIQGITGSFCSKEYTDSKIAEHETNEFIKKIEGKI